MWRSKACLVIKGEKYKSSDRSGFQWNTGWPIRTHFFPTGLGWFPNLNSWRTEQDNIYS